MSPQILIFGEVLFDCFPNGKQILGGAPFNVAWHLQAFGVAPLLISRVGNDGLGTQIKTAMQAWGMDCSGLQVDPDRPTGTVTVQFNGEEPLYDIVNPCASSTITPPATIAPPTYYILGPDLNFVIPAFT